MRHEPQEEDIVKLLQALLLFALVLVVFACDDKPGTPVTIELTGPQGTSLEFAGRFGKHEQWQKVSGSTAAELRFDLADWPACFCLHRLVVRKTSPGSDTLRIRAICDGVVESDTFTVGQDSLDYPPFKHIGRP